MNFSGTITSDFMKLAPMALNRRVDLINFAATDFLSLRDSLINYVKAAYPDEYKYFVESDLGMMFIELAAYQGAVMSMKADMLANENYIATAQQRTSVKKLLELIGVRMRGPLSAAADAQITFQDSLASTGAITISPAQRTFEVLSPEDGAQVTYTLYKVVNGLVDQATRQANITLDPAAEGEGTDRNVFSNLVVQEGSLVVEAGEFAATEGQKTIPLADGPVVEGSVEVFVTSPNSDSNGVYSEVDSIYFASGASDKIFEIAYDEFYNATVVLGTGVAGISPPDSSTYTVTYRVGGGTRGNLARRALATSVVAEDVSNNTFAGTLTNTSKATGGSNAESIAHAKKYAPLTFRRQDRLVTLTDYSTFANTFISTFGTVGKATAATRNAYSSANTIDIYLLEKASDSQLQRATSNFKTQLLAAMNQKKMMTDDIVIVDGLIRTLDLVCTIRIDQEQKQNEDSIKAKVRDKITNYLSIDNTEFGEDLIVSDLNRQIFEVNEVRFSTLDNVNQDIRIDFNEIIQLNNLTINIEYLS